MVIQVASANTTYCLVKQVENFLNLGTLTEATTPKKSVVEMFIHQAEDEIDFRTMFSWRHKRVTIEYDYPVEQFYRTRFYIYSIWFDGLVIPLNGRRIARLDATKGDSLKLRSGNGTYEDWLSTKTQGVGSDFWVTPENGNLHVKKRWAINMIDTIQITYRAGAGADTTVNGTNLTSATTLRVDDTKYFTYNGIAFASTSNGSVEALYYNGLNGTQLLNVSRAQHGTTKYQYEDGERLWQVPGDIIRACILLTAVAIAHNDYLSVNENFGPGMAYEDISKRIDEWKSEADEILMRRTEVQRV